MKSFLRWFTIRACKLGLDVLCRIHKENWDRIPAEGPLLAYANHTAMVEAPLVFTQIAVNSKKVTGIGKAESWDNWFLNWIFTLWGLIPIRRGEADMAAMKKSLDALKDGYIMGISPEGTRSKSGKLIKAHGGFAMLALHSGAPLIPIAHWGGENFGENVKKLKRTNFEIRVGQVFYLDAKGEKVTKEIRQQMADEMMYQLAKLLPEEHRGDYADLENATEKYLRFV